MSAAIPASRLRRVATYEDVHTGVNSGTWKSWRSMIGRIDNPKGRQVKAYAGLDVDPRWRNYAVFLADMGVRPMGTTLDRKDNVRGYWLDNCRWATQEVQTANRRHARTHSVRNKVAEYGILSMEERLSFFPHDVVNPAQLQQGKRISDATEAPVSRVQRPVKPACLHCQGHENLMHNGLCRDCDSIELIREAWASEIALFIQAPGA